MKRVLLTVVVIASLVSVSNAQTTTAAPTMNWKKLPSLGINFVLNDFTTATRIQNNSLGGVLKDKDWATFNEMAYGLSVQYMQGLTNHVDFSTNLTGSFLKYPFKNKATTSEDALLLELDATLHLKLLTDKYCVVPYANVGVGISAYKLSNYAAYFPIGMGFQINLGSQDAFLFTQADYKTAITNSGANHFTYSIGFSAPLKSK
jgi:OmpA-OmpF porin, OOP family